MNTPSPHVGVEADKAKPTAWLCPAGTGLACKPVIGRVGVGRKNAEAQVRKVNSIRFCSLSAYGGVRGLRS